ncbi:hypothetical protein [Caulobacter sp. 1776]|uniref:hypothetical protein n=1 Tax=Caulobacter sp. 1776 TaxID=3156420 RepID=UPI003394D56C
MTAMLAPMNQVRDLVLDSTRNLKPSVEVLDADVEEVVGSDEEPALLIKLHVVHQKSEKDWTLSRVRMIQKIRDELINSGDQRYPFVTVLTDDEWKRRRK